MTSALEPIKVSFMLGFSIILDSCESSLFWPTENQGQKQWHAYINYAIYNIITNLSNYIQLYITQKINIITLMFAAKIL